MPPFDRFEACLNSAHDDALDVAKRFLPAYRKSDQLREVQRLFNELRADAMMSDPAEAYPAMRAHLLDMVGRALIWLALDEADRGEEAIEAELTAHLRQAKKLAPRCLVHGTSTHPDMFNNDCTCNINEPWEDDAVPPPKRPAKIAKVVSRTVRPPVDIEDDEPTPGYQAPSDPPALAKKLAASAAAKKARKAIVTSGKR